MRKIIISTWLSMAFMLAGSAQGALEIIQKSLDLVTGESNYAEVRMSIVRPSWQRDIEMKTWSLGTEYSLIVISDPARDKGTAFLKRKNELWNWQPRIERVIKMPPSMMLQSWMGSDFTNDDLVKQSSIADDYSHVLLGSEEIEGRQCYKIQLTPKEDAPVVWGKVISWITEEGYLTLRNEFYDEDGYLVNTMRGRAIKSFDGRMLPSILEIIPADEDGQKTVIEYLDLTYDIDHKESFFSVQNMKRIKV